MTTIRSGSGQVLKSGNGQALLWRPLRASSGTTTTPTAPTTPAGIPTLSGWWQAGTINNLLDTSGNPIVAWGSTVGSLQDLSTAAQPLTPYHVSGTAPLVATARLSGLLGGVGAFQSFAGIGTNLPAPVLDADTGLSAGNRAMGASQAWTIFLVWSRPNWRRNVYGAVTGPLTLLRVGTTNVLQVDGADGSGRLVLFPGTSQTALSTAMTRRHTHHVIIRNTPGVGVDVWLDGTQIGTAQTNTLSGNFTGPLTLLHDQSGAQGAAQCYFHEAAFFTSAISTTYVANLISYAGRWTVGSRKCISVIVSGQSNAGNAINDGAPTLMVQGAAWHLGALAWNVVGTYGTTAVGGHGISNVPFSGDTSAPGSYTLSGSFLADPGDGSSPAGWSLGTDGLGFQTFIQTTTSAADLADVKAIVWYWSESDSSRPYSEKAKYTAAVYNLLAKERAMIPGATAANMPLIWWHPMPFLVDQGNQMVREVIAAIVADSSQNVVVGNPQTADSNPRGSTPNSDGTSTGGDGAHLDSLDNIRLAHEAAPVVARTILASSGGDTLTSIPTGIPTVGGPRITHAYRASNTTVILTVTHDTGTDLVVALQAANGAGFCVVDGGTAYAPQYQRLATACTRIDATHLQLTLGAALVNQSSACLLCYPYGQNWIGRGDAVTDNYSTVIPPAGWDIGGDLGSQWKLNFPLAATFTPIALSDTP